MSTETALSTFALTMCLVKKIGPKREKKNLLCGLMPTKHTLKRAKQSSSPWKSMGQGYVFPIMDSAAGLVPRHYIKGEPLPLLTRSWLIFSLTVRSPQWRWASSKKSYQIKTHDKLDCNQAVTRYLIRQVINCSALPVCRLWRQT